MSNILSPARMTFLSFRHSQGNVEAQLCWFAYMQNGHDIEPDLYPDKERLERYAGFIMAGAGTHLNVDNHETFTPNRRVITGFEELQDLWPLEKVELLGYSTEELALEAAGHLLAHEAKLLNRQTPWGSEISARNLDAAAIGRMREYREQRLVRRVTDGPSSLLMHHGRDGQPTEHPFFDEFYGAMWGEIEKAWQMPAFLPDMATRISNHEAVVAEAEMAILGRLVLGREAALPVAAIV